MSISLFHRHCPECGSNALRPSRRRGPIERFLFVILFLVPYRCRDCEERHFRFGLPRSSTPARTHSHL
jgi:hypothetical protein